MKTKSILVAICIILIASTGAIALAEDETQCKIPTPTLSVIDITSTYAYVDWAQIEIPTCCGDLGPEEYVHRYVGYIIWINDDLVWSGNRMPGWDMEELIPGTEYRVEVQAIPSASWHECESSDNASITFTTPESRTVEVTVGRSDIPLFYMGDTSIESIPCTVTDLIDQDVGICDGRKSKEECWEGTSLIGTFTIESWFKGWKELSLWNNNYDGFVEADLTADPKTVEIWLYGTGELVTFTTEPFVGEFVHEVNGPSPVEVPHMLDWEYSGGIYDLRFGEPCDETIAVEYFKVYINHEGELAGTNYNAFESDKPYPFENGSCVGCYPGYDGYLLVNQTQRTFNFVFTEYPEAQPIRVVDKDTGEPLVGVKVIAITSGESVQECITDGDGRCTLRVKMDAKYAIRAISPEGYECTISRDCGRMVIVPTSEVTFYLTSTSN